MKRVARAAVGCICMAVGLIALPAPGTAQAQAPAAEVKLPKIVRLGLESYRKDGLDEAMKAWVKGGVLENGPEPAQAAAMLGQAQTRYGAYRGFDLIRVQAVSSSTELVYLTLDYDRGPVFAKFVVYRTQIGTVLTDFAFAMDEAAVIPSCG